MNIKVFYFSDLSKIEPKNSNERMEEIKKEEIQNEFSPVTNQKTQEKLNEISKEININVIISKILIKL